jgi:hypothetical protein
MLIIFDISYFVIKKIDFKSNKIFKKLFYIIGIFLIVISISRILVPSLYNDLIDIRTISENNLADANTLIKNVLTNNSSLINYIGNYIINLFRMLIPIELVTKGAIYIIFFFYQLMISYILFNGAKKANKSNLLPFCVVLSYFLASVTFEPDFGSVVRHESTLAIIIFLLERNCVYVEEKGDINGES